MDIVGELALQLGGVALYQLIKANDQARTVPQGIFTEILRKASPCLILLDELADYCVGASGVPVEGTTLADQTVSFAQQLTQAVAEVKDVALVATLPASHLEVASSIKGQEILNSLELRFGRMSADTKPVADEEIYEVVRRRLFESLGDPAEHEKVASAFMNLYQQHRNEVPAEAVRGPYKERITGAFPFHPSVIDGFYLRWGSHGDFQRTRGVLRLLASIVGDLWQRRHTESQSQPLIQPCHIRWDIDALHATLTRLWGAAYETVAAADVIGEKSNAPFMDEEKGGDYITEKITQGLAASILLGSFGAQGERAGYSTQDLRLCIGRPTLNWGYTDGALLSLEDRAFFLHSASAGSLGKRYWFGTKPTLTKLIVQYRSQFVGHDFNQEILDTVKEQVQAARPAVATWRVLIDPQTDLPEQKSLTLLIMHPELSWSENGGRRDGVEKQLLELSTKCGSRERLYRNTLLFLLPFTRGLSKLRGALCEVSALSAVSRDYGSQLDNEQKEDLKGRLSKAKKDVTESLGTTYAYIARIEGRSVSVAPVSDIKSQFDDHLGSAWQRVVDEEEWVLKKTGTVTMQTAGLMPKEGGIRVKDAVDSFLRYTDKPMIATKEAVLKGIRQACKERLIGIGRGLQPSSLQRRWCGEEADLDPNEEGLWIIPPFEPEIIIDVIKPPGTRPNDESDEIGEPSLPGRGPGPEATPPIAPSRQEIRLITLKGKWPLKTGRMYSDALSPPEYV